MVGRVSRQALRQLGSVIPMLEKEGVKAVVLACTELEQMGDVNVHVLPIYDSSRIHAQRAAGCIPAEV